MSEIPSDRTAHNQQLIEEFRAGRGAGGRPLLLLTTTGARTGRRRTTPMMYLRVGGHLVVVASNAGARRHPDWYHNLLADPSITVELGSKTYDTKAVVLRGDERDRLFAEVVKAAPFFADHQAQVDRTIPVVIVDALNEN